MTRAQTIAMRDAYVQAAMDISVAGVSYAVPGLKFDRPQLPDVMKTIRQLDDDLKGFKCDDDPDYGSATVRGGFGDRG